MNESATFDDALAERIRELDAEPADRRRLRKAVQRLAQILPDLPDADTLLLAPEAVDAWRTLREHDPELYIAYLASVRKTCGRPIADLVQQRIGPLPPPSESAAWPAPLDLSALATYEPDAPRHIVPAWMPEGEVTLFAGHGGAGKSAIAMHLAVCMALGRPWYGMAVAARRVYYISCEDGRDIIHWRLSRIGRQFGVALDADLSERLRIIDASEIDPELMIELGRGEEPILTALYTDLAERIERDSVVILDGASDTYGASEIVRRHVRRFIRALRRLAGEHGAVLLLAHVDKAAARKKENGDRYSGSTAWHNSVRARWELESDGDELVLTLAKANHAQAVAEIRVRWDATAHMHLPIDTSPNGGIVAAIRERNEREVILSALRGCMASNPPIDVPTALTGPRTTWHVLSQRPESPTALRAEDRATRARFARLLETLRQSGDIIQGPAVMRSGHRVATLVARVCRA